MCEVLRYREKQPRRISRVENHALEMSLLRYRYLECAWVLLLGSPTGMVACCQGTTGTLFDALRVIFVLYRIAGADDTFGSGVIGFEGDRHVVGAVISPGA